jgi:ABC-type branched-subunit amino acid transport system substrate-binding protein
MIAAIQQTLARRGYRAGAHRVGLRVCDDSTALRGLYDPTKCSANARAYVADRRVIAEIGPYNSPCAKVQIPILAAAPGGPLGVVSPTASDPLLTRPGNGKSTGAFARLVATDERQAQLAARFLRSRGRARVFVLNDTADYGLAWSNYFAAAARRDGLTVVGRGAWRNPARDAPLIRRVRRARPDVVWLSGQLDNDAGRIVRELRRALPGVTIGGNDGLLPVGRLYDGAGAAATGVLIASGWPPSATTSVPGLAARATDAVLDAIARSDGTRRSVARALRAQPQFTAVGDLGRAPVTILRVARPGGSRQNTSPEGAPVVTVVR